MSSNISGNRSSGFKNTSFYETERHHTVLSHSDFAKDAEFENLEESSELVEYLLSKDYDKKYFTIKRNNSVEVDTSIANKIFYECYQKFKNDLDAVQIFSIVTDFFKVDSTYFYNKLVVKLRKLLFRDLQNRMDVKNPNIKKIDNTHVQQSFAASLSNKKI